MLSRRKFCAMLAAVLVLSPAVLLGQKADNGTTVIKLLPPTKSGGRPIMDAFAARKSANGNYINKPIPDKVLSDMLWATWGINRSDGKRTVPTALNSQEVNLYVVRSDGVWLYEAKEHALIRYLDKDYRGKLGGGEIVFLYAAPDGSWPGMHVGSIYQNANLYAASIGLGSHVHAGGSDGLVGIMRLPLGYRFWIAQSFGYTQ